MSTDSASKRIGVVIPTFNRVDYLRTLLQQLNAQVCEAGTEILPLVVDDGCTDSTRVMLAVEFPTVSVLKGPGNWWWTKSVNEGARYALTHLKPDYILLLNDDSQIGPDYLDAVLKAYAEAGTDCIIGSLSVSDKEPVRVSFSGIRKIDWLRLKKYKYHNSFELLSKIPETGLYPTYALNGRGTFLRAALFEQLNFLNAKDFPQYGSDDDLALRAWKKNVPVLIAYSCRITDRTGDTSKGTAFRQDPLGVFLKSFVTRTSVNYIPKQLRFFYTHGIKILLPFYLLKFLLGTGYAYFFKYKRLNYEL